MKPPKFSIHVNRELGNQKFYSERDYRSAMKSAGVEHYDHTSVKKRENKPYERSEWAKGMMKDIVDRKGRPPGDRFLKELDKRGFNQKSYEKARQLGREMK